MKAHTGLHALRSQQRIVPRLYRIAANAIADHFRAQRPTEELPEDFPAPERERAFTAELARCVAPFLAGLPETYREALQLSEIDGLPQREAAERLGLSLSGAKSRVQRGRRLLRERFLECCEIEATAGGLDYAPRRRSCGCGQVASRVASFCGLVRLSKVGAGRRRETRSMEEAMETISRDEIKQAVRSRYAQVAQTHGSCCAPSCCGGDRAPTDAEGAFARDGLCGRGAGRSARRRQPRPRLRQSAGDRRVEARRDGTRPGQRRRVRLLSRRASGRRVRPRDRRRHDAGDDLPRAPAPSAAAIATSSSGSARSKACRSPMRASTS